MCNNENQERFKNVSAILVLLLGVFIAATIVHIYLLKGTAKVINYAGIIRGGSQRLIKLEIAGRENDQLEKKIETILEGLSHGGTEYKLSVMKDKEFQYELELLQDNWNVLKEESESARFNGWESTKLLSVSEEFFAQADKTVFAAEAYSERVSRGLVASEIAMVVLIVLNLCILGQEYIHAFKLSHQNQMLNVKAFIDEHTGLPNKNKCEEILSNSGFLDDRTTCIMFDLNNLKKVNDSLGHVAGDTMIMNFAHVLRTAIPGNDFVGRYGGDEFIAILYDSSKNQGKEVIEEVQKMTDEFNKQSTGVRLSFAAGSSYSASINQCTMKTLLEKADEEMYLNKRKMKEARL